MDISSSYFWNSLTHKYFAWDSFIFAVILGGLGIVSSYFALDKYPDEENINFTGAALSYSCIMIVIGILLDKFFD